MAIIMNIKANQMIDVHTHTLFGMDDGSHNIEESLTMIEMQYKQGVKKIACTPHFNFIKDDIDQFIIKRNYYLEELRNSLKRMNSPVELLGGAEVLFSSDILEFEVDKLLIENTDYILIEFPTRIAPINLYNQMVSLTLKGVTPIIAHIERYEFFKENLRLMFDLVQLGCIFQVNATTFIERKDEKFIKACVKHNLIHIIASDSHRANKRVPNILDGYRTIEARYGEGLSNYFKNNVTKVIKNELIDLKDPSEIKKIMGMYR